MTLSGVVDTCIDEFIEDSYDKLCVDGFALKEPGLLTDKYKTQAHKLAAKFRELADKLDTAANAEGNWMTEEEIKVAKAKAEAEAARRMAREIEIYGAPLKVTKR